ncbi:YgiT-type zinc finger protein [Sutcliffiella horikoshii]|uniref:YgiT-type zinc finger protein n=1 Tax=Sutcliffiella horikoshii TaxID=79883 RepID=UPI001CFDCF6B|nr:YgiT-type zinc finger protein [Sutcliffiella horikoshii]
MTHRECMCGEFAVPAKITIQEEFEDKELVIRNFPVFKCLQCDETTLSPKDYVEYYKKAVKHYETTNENEFDCNLNRESW